MVHKLFSLEYLQSFWKIHSSQCTVYMCRFRMDLEGFKHDGCTYEYNKCVLRLAIKHIILNHNVCQFPRAIYQQYAAATWLRSITVKICSNLISKLTGLLLWKYFLPLANRFYGLTNRNSCMIRLKDRGKSGDWNTTPN